MKMNWRKQTAWLFSIGAMVFGVDSIAKAQTSYTYCATEGGYCAFSGSKSVRYGAGSSWVYKTLTGGTACDNTVFGDPLYGTQKQCQTQTISALPDLVVTSISFSPSAPAPGQPVTFSAVVKNIGTVSTPSGVDIGVQFLVDGKAISWGATSSALAAGASATLTARSGYNGGASTYSAVSGSHTVTAFVDDVNRMTESNETNNKLNVSLNVGPATSTSTTSTTSTTLAPTTTTTTTLPQASTGNSLTITQAISDMSLSSEALPIAAYTSWMYKPVITQPSPAGSSIASWWTGERPTWCYGLLSWYTLYEAEGNKAINTRVEVKNLRVYILSNSTRTWSQWNLVVAPNTGLWNYPFTGGSSAPDRRIESDGGVSFLPVYPNFRHGYGNSNYPAKALPNPSDVRAVFVAIDMRLVVNDPARADDRDLAKYVVDSGADYYPDGTYKMWSLGYAPGVGNGRYLLATKSWRSATLLVPNNLVGATYDEIRNNPPPMN